LKLQTLGPKFLHIYLTTPKEILENILPKADQNGYRAIVMTCDHPTDRVRDDVLPLFEEASKYTDPQLQNSMPMPNMNLPDIIVKQNFSTGSITWANIEWIKKLTTLPIICKGILSPIDAELAVKHGAHGIIVRFVCFLYPISYLNVSFACDCSVIMVVDKLIQHHQLLNV
jgi:(S)-2-hydroxy-acid oxidase